MGAVRYPEGGTYLGPVDFAFNGPDRQFTRPRLGFVGAWQPAEPKQRGEGGRVDPLEPRAWLDGTMGFYMRKFADKLPQTFLTQVAPQRQPLQPDLCRWHRLYGMSLAKSIGGISSVPSSRTAATRRSTARYWASRRACPPRADTRARVATPSTAVVNLLGAIVPKTPLFDSAAWLTELAWSSWHQGHQRREPVQRARLRGPALGKDKWDGCATKYYVGIGLSLHAHLVPGVPRRGPRPCR